MTVHFSGILKKRSSASRPGAAAAAAATIPAALAASMLLLVLLLPLLLPCAVFAAQFEDTRCRTTYEIFVYSFCDSDGDGIGDLNGVRSKLDYIQDLGFDQIWLMPVCPSPTYHKYDVTDYMAIDPVYGTMEDFEALLSDCHERGICVITDLVLNHTSSEHPWFRAAADYLEALPDGQDPDPAACPEVGYYHFTRNAETGYAQLPDTSWYYEARFWEGMPDLDLDNSAVREEIREILSFWLAKGVDGFRLDAVTSYYTGSNTQNIEFLRWLKDAAVEAAANASADTAADAAPESAAQSSGASAPEQAEMSIRSPYIVCEVWTDQTVYAQYYASGADSMFDFACAGAEGLIAKTVKGNIGADRFVQSLADEQALFSSFSDSAVNAPFYTNHDLDRSAGYYAYDDGSRTKFALGLNLMMSGNAFLYYGDEIGMKGSGKDENKRAPMLWTADADDAAADAAPPMCSGPPDMDAIKQKFPPVSEQEADPLSILNYVKHAVSLRHAYDAIRCGTVEPVQALCSKEVGAYRKSVSDDISPEALSASKTGTSGTGGASPAIEVIFNSSDAPQSVDLSASGNDFRTLADSLCVTQEEVSLKGDLLTLPPFSISILVR